MPSVRSPAKVVVTGASGFIGCWTVRAFLERGYDVRGVVRSKAKGEWIGNQDWVRAAPGKFEYAVVENMETVGAFDEAVKDIEVVVHTASPVSFTKPDKDPYEIINEAVGGTLGVLNSAFTHGSAVKRVVITSSVAAAVNPSMTHVRRVYSEEDWNTYSVEEIESKGVAANALDKYRASKVKAERAAWEFVDEHKGQLNFEVTSILPCFVYGPTIHEISSSEKVNASVKVFIHCMRNEVRLDSLIGNGNLVDVRDVAAMHVDVAESDAAAGERFFASSAVHTWQDVYDALNAHSNPIAGVPVGTPGAGKNVFRPFVYCGEKAERVLGIKYRPLEETCYDTLASLRDRGFW